MAGPRIRSAVVLDRQPLCLDALDQLLERLGLAVAAKETRVAAALAAIEQRRPDVFLVDLDAADDGLGGLDCIRSARALVPTIRVVVLSTDRGVERIPDAFAAGAAAYVVKTAHLDDIAAAVKQVFERSVYLSRAPFPSVRPGAADRLASGLTAREAELLALIPDGYSNTQLAQALRVTEQTVKFHLSNIYRKLGVSNRTEAARAARLLELREQSSAGGRSKAA